VYTNDDFKLNEEIEIIFGDYKGKKGVIHSIIDNTAIVLINNKNIVSVKLHNIKPSVYTQIPAIYFDLDGTIAEYHGWKGEQHIGDPIPDMINLIKNILDERKYKVKIFTARCEIVEYIPFIRKWVEEHIGVDLEITNVKGFDCVLIIDDRACNVKSNEGIGENLRHVLNNMGI